MKKIVYFGEQTKEKLDLDQTKGLIDWIEKAKIDVPALCLPVLLLLLLFLPQQHDRRTITRT